MTRRALLSTALALSLAANAFLLSRELGHALRPHGDPLAYEQITQRLVRRLPAADRAVFRAALDARRGRLDAAGHELHDARLALRAALTAQPVDAAALARACARTRAAAATIYAVVHEAMVEVAPRISAQGRADLLRPLPQG